MKALPWFLLLVLITTYLPLYNPADAAAVMQRGPAGEWVRKESTPLKLGWHLGGAIAYSEGSNAFLPQYPDAQTDPIHISRIWIINRSTGHLAHEFGRMLQESLLHDEHLFEVAYFPASDLPLEIRRPPHVFITYKIDDSYESHGPIWHRWGMDLEIQMGRAPFGVTPGRMGSQPDPARIETYHHDSTSVGWITRAVRFDRGIRRTLDRLNAYETIQKWRGPDATLEEPPLEWAGPTPQAPSNWAWLNALDPQRIVSQAPPPLLQQHAWIIPTPEVKRPLEVLAATLEGEGFQTFARWDDQIRFAEKPGTRITLQHPNPNDTSEIAIQAVIWPSAQELAQWVQRKAEDPMQHGAIVQTLDQQPQSVLDALMAELQGSDMSPSVESLLNRWEASLPTPEDAK